MEEDQERELATQNYHCQQLENEYKKLEDVMNRQEADLINSRMENDELERK